MSGNYYSIDIWGLLIALVMVAVARSPARRGPMT